MSRKLCLAVATAAVLWFLMFSPWTRGLVNFWIGMTISALVLLGMGLAFTPDREQVLKVEKPLMQLLGGIALAFALWGIFWIGDKVSAWMFDFARPQVENVYSMKAGLPPWTIALLLLFLIGPAEEFFWRGYVQRTLGKLLPGEHASDHAFLLTAAVYALVHVWSFNFMLVMAALTAGLVWGLVYRLRPGWLPALVVSHAVWDALVFIIIPI